MTDNFCIIPWVHLYFSPNGEVQPCCVSRGICGNLRNETIEEVWNGTMIKNIRVQLLNNEQPKECAKCYKQESVGFRSPRIQFNDDFGSHEQKAREVTKSDGTVEDLNLIYWDFRFSNLCNFKCRMCGHELSSAWYDETIEMKPNYKFDRIIHINDNSIVNINQYLERFFDVVEEIYFAGGEPLLMDEHYFILDKLIELGRTDVKLRYNTNLSKMSYKGKNVLDYWRYFQDVNVHVSIDGKGKVAEYIRSGLRWDNFERNLKNVIEIPNVKLGIGITTQILNVCDLPNLTDYLLDLGIDEQKFIMNNILKTPIYYNISIIPLELKTQIVKILLDYTKTLENRGLMKLREDYIGIIKTLLGSASSLEQFEKFRDITMSLDNKRNESLADVAPLISEWINNEL